MREGEASIFVFLRLKRFFLKKHKNLVLVAALLVVVISAVFFLNSYLKNQIILKLEKEFPTAGLSYENITVNFLSGNTSISNILLKRRGVRISASRVEVKDFSYSTYVRTGNIEIGLLELISPEVVVNKSDTTATSNGSRGDEERDFLIKKFRAIGGSLRVVENDSSANSLFISLKRIELEKVLFANKPESGLLPFEYSSRNVESDSLYYNINAWQYITVKNLKYTNDLELSNFSILPKYSPAQFDQKISYQKDWIALKVERIIFKDLDLDKRNDSLFYKSPETIVENANLRIYRNKLVNEDTRIKQMYSQMLRELGVKFQLDSISIKNSKIVYEEKILESRPPAELSFHNVNAGINDLRNHSPGAEKSPLIRVKAEAVFMGNSRLTLNWDFNVNSSLDEFHVSGRLAAIKAEAMNPFLKHAMNVETEGLIESLAYNFYGNRNSARGNMQMEYRDFKVQILKDGEEKRKSLITRLANLIIKNEAVNEDVTQENIEVERDKTKSFWNFLWLCIRDGALKTFL